MSTIRSDLIRCNLVLFLGIPHRVEAIEVDILPRFLHLYRTIQGLNFKEKKKESQNVFGRDKNRGLDIHSSIIQEKGCSSLQNFEHYFCAAQGHTLISGIYNGVYKSQVR